MLSKGVIRFSNLSARYIRCCLHERHLCSSSCDANFTSEGIVWPEVPKTPIELAEYIKSHCFWVSDDFIASVKPYGISAYGVPWSVLHREQRRAVDAEAQQGLPFDNWDGNEDEEEVGDLNEPFTLTVASVLPELARMFDGEDLTITKTVPKYYEGPLLLARNEKARRAAKISLIKATTLQSFRIKSLCFCVGRPKEEEGEGWCYSRMEFISDTEGYQCTLHPTAPSSTAIKRGLMRRGYFRYRLLAYDAAADCSLVELEMKKMQHQLDRLFLLEKGCPILGDAVHQKCNARILGRPIYVPHKRASIRNQYIPTGLLKKLGISLKEYHELPLFAHVHTLLMPSLVGPSKKRREDVELRSRIPSYFLSLLQVFDWLRVVEEDEQKRRHQGEEEETVKGDDD